MKQLRRGAEFEGKRHLVSESESPVEEHQTQCNEGVRKMEMLVVLESRRTPEL